MRDLAALLHCRLDLREGGANCDEKHRADECAYQCLPDRCLLHGCSSIFACCRHPARLSFQACGRAGAGRGIKKPSRYSCWPCSVMQARYV